ncbi:uncharacterized protein LOC112898451 [Panicum hallii]|uniref:uncharacterized protein LOC112898451 n=1 Tax=Panicum hallii TaxID=206008 RepID=UPI000DF4D62C|nr:uncharacterized protein LOC112898451 [Panicum hallii]
MVEALVCAHDWLRRTTPIDIKENMEELEIMEKELIEEFGNHKAQNIGKGKEKEKEAFHYQDTSNNDINTNRKQLQVYLESRNIYILKGWCTGAAGWFGGLELDHNCTWMEVM